jgi:hypothetical protein
MFNKKKKERILDVSILLKDDDEQINIEVTDILLTNGFVVLFYLDGKRDYLNNDIIYCIQAKERPDNVSI